MKTLDSLNLSIYQNAYMNGTMFKVYKKSSYYWNYILNHDYRCLFIFHLKTNKKENTSFLCHYF